MAAFLLYFSFSNARAQTGTEAADTAAIKQVVKAYTDGWNTRDAKALAMLFTEDADYTTVRGGNTHGRKALEEMFVGLLTGTGRFATSQRTDSVERLRFISPVVAVVDDYWVVESPGQPPMKGLYSWVMVKENGRWLTAVHHATNFAENSR